MSGNLPVQPTSFVGRAEEVRAVSEALGRAHLVTVTGVGGVGKTRLAVQVAAELVPAFADGAWLYEQAVAGDADTVAQVVASTLAAVQRAGRSLERSVVEFLRPSHLLLVLDNCELLLDASGRAGGGHPGRLPPGPDAGDQPGGACRAGRAGVAAAVSGAAGGGRRVGCRAVPMALSVGAQVAASQGDADGAVTRLRDALTESIRDDDWSDLTVSLDVAVDISGASTGSLGRRPLRAGPRPRV
jgi:hypothetical protein